MIVRKNCFENAGRRNITHYRVGNSPMWNIDREICVANKAFSLFWSKPCHKLRYNPPFT
jgi:hypothetical protein